MDFIHIAELTPELPARDTKQFKAAVTLIWPYSSSQRQFALLLSEPDFRLRRKKGQVRVRFSGSSAKALATTGVGIGDEVVLSLRGAQFVQEDTVSTPGRSIDWELEYTQTVAVHVFREGAEIATLELYDAAPTPAPRSPVRRQNDVIPSPVQQWSSPAFLKRARLSDGPFFEAPYDPLADENAEGPDKKRRRKSYRDWKAWTYNARTPSPEKGDVGAEEELEEMDASPSRPSQLPQTPLSPAKSQSVSVSAGGDAMANDRPQAEGATEPTVDERVGTKASQIPNPDHFLRDDEYYDLYAGPDEDRPSRTQYAFGGDTEANTEEEEETLEDTDAASMSPTEVASEDLEQDNHEPDLNMVEPPTRDAVVVTIDDVDSADIGFATGQGSRVIEAAPKIVMPPPTLPTLNTSFHVPISPSALTPIGKEPASPTLKPMDSDLLPLPSPFPGERDPNPTSYFDQFSTSDQFVVPEMEEEGPPSEANYIMENSFFSSIGSSKSNAFHPDHESAFTPVRFTFGMDGAGFSRPLDLSSPAPEETKAKAIGSAQDHAESAAVGGLTEFPESLPHTFEASVSVKSPAADEFGVEWPPSAQSSPKPTQSELEIIELSSDVEEEESEEIEIEDDAVPDEAVTIDEIEREECIPPSTDQSTAVSAIVDLGSPSAGNDQDDVKYETLEASNTEQPGREDVSPIADSSLQDQVQGYDALPHVQPEEPKIDQRPIELTATEYGAVLSNFTSNFQEIATTHTATQDGLHATMEADEDAQPLVTDLLEPYPAIEFPDTFLENNLLEAGPSQDEHWGRQDVEDFHPDVKLESIEEGSVFRIGEPDTQEGQEEIAEPSGEILIEVPEEGHKLGETHTISVPATGPARNTRSKAKTSASPATEDISLPKRTTRSTKSRASVTPLDPTTMSPSVDGHQTSPYSLRSQSKLLSPTKSTSVATAATRQSPRKHASQQSVDSIPDVGTPQLHDTDPFLASFQPSQELGASQGRYSNVSFVKDSEEESMPSENSLSTVKYSDDWNTFTNFSDPAVEHENEDANLKPPPASAPQAEMRTAVRTELKRSGAQGVVSSKGTLVRHEPSGTEPSSQGSPSRRLRSAGSVEGAPSSPRITRVTRQHSRNVSLASYQADELSDTATPQAKRFTYPTLPGKGEDTELLKSPPASDNIDEDMRSSPPAAAANLLKQQSIIDSNRPMTPEATQQTTLGTQNSTIADQQQRLPMTPQLTQATSTGLRSGEKSTAIKNTTGETPTKSSPMRVTRSTPRRNATQTDVASPSTTPKAHSPDVSSEVSATAVEEPEEPSIGLSTPIAYYTPLNSLTFFLNRSSQFHTSSNPDVLALVTSGSTPPQRAIKGRKDWSTTLHITDVSTYPSTTTVNIFRPYQNALPAADAGDVILLRAFAVKSLNRHPTLTSADESSWCVWRYNKPVWGAKRGIYGELKAREEVKGPVVERGEGEWREVEKIRAWYVGKVKGEMEDKVHTRSQDRKEVEEEVKTEGSQRVTRSRDKHLDG